MITHADQYQWSSYNARMNGNEPVIPDIHPSYLALGNSMKERRLRYQEFVESAIPDGEWVLIQEAVTRGQLTGNDRYIDEVEKIIGRRIEHRRPGRPESNQKRNK